MNKILIIGQAPPAVKQVVPYDTTMLYEILSWVGISKENAQDIFEFEAVSDVFPGHGQKGHIKPDYKLMDKHWEILEPKIQLADKVWILGNVARDYISYKPKTWSCNTIFLQTMHPSKRNYNLIMKNKDTLIKNISEFLSV